MGPSTGSGALADVDVIAAPRAGVQLPWPANAHVGIGDHLLPVRHPADGARDREHHREHRAWNADGAVDDARIEIDVRVELAADEVLVLESDLLEAQRELEQRIVGAPESGEHLVRHLADDLGARIEVLVDAMPEANEPEMAGL